jgi:hypothetical protein
MTENDLKRRIFEHEQYLDRMRAAVRQRLTSNGCSPPEIERFLAGLPTEPIGVVIRQVLSARRSRHL